MKDLETYQDVCSKCSALITKSYSTSFRIGIGVLHKKYRKPIQHIYGFVRLADEIVDTLQVYNQPQLIAEFRSDTFKALDRGVSMNPVLHAFQATVKEYGIDTKLIDAFLKSMEMDLCTTRYEEENFRSYIYGSAESVGLMCLQVFCGSNPAQYRDLQGYAQKLGSAFQKVNFLRDIRSDYFMRGRSYFPGVDVNKGLDEAGKRLIEKDILSEFREAKQGIDQLPQGCREGVYLAFRYYHRLLKRIQRASVPELMKDRIRISNFRKGLIYVDAIARSRFHFT